MFYCRSVFCAALIAAISLPTALAQQARSAPTGASAAAADPAPPYGHVWEDLHIWAQGAFRQPVPLLDQLSAMSPRQFLPDALADFVINCERARRAGDEVVLAACRNARPLGRVRTLVLIPPQLLAAASLRGGAHSHQARAVLDCTGLHLQIPVDRVRQSDQLQLLSRVFRDAVSDAFQNSVSGVTQLGVAGGARTPGMTEVYSCGMGAGASAPSRVRFGHGEFRDVGDRFAGGSWEVGETLPRAYITQACFTPSGPQRQLTTAQVLVTTGGPLAAPDRGPQNAAPLPPGGVPSVGPIPQAPVPASAGPDEATQQALAQLKREVRDACESNAQSQDCRDATETFNVSYAAAYPSWGSPATTEAASGGDPAAADDSADEPAAPSGELPDKHPPGSKR